MSLPEKSAVHFQEVPGDEDGLDMHPRGQRPITRTHLNFWKAATLILAATTLIQIPFSNIFILSTYEHGFTTDFPDSEGADRLVERRFSYPIRTAADGTLFVPTAQSSSDYPLPGQFDSPDQDAARFVGPPSGERDRAWQDLTGPRYFALSGDERDWMHGDASLNATTTWPLATNEQPLAYGGVDVLHSLHCLDSLRRRIDRADFPDAASGVPSSPDESASRSPLGAGFERMHVEHCINQLRESVMCHADTTPVTLRSVEMPAQGQQQRVQVLLGETERMHTCRDFDAVRTWVAGRVAERGSAA